jgi:transposase
MDERLRFVARLLEGEKMAPLCAEFGISRKTGYKIFDRYKDCGVQAFSDRSHRAHRQANRLPAPIEATIVRLKREYPGWGAPKIREKLRQQFTGPHLPAISTVHAVLDRHGLVHHRRRRRGRATGTALSRPTQPNVSGGSGERALVVSFRVTGCRAPTPTYSLKRARSGSANSSASIDPLVRSISPLAPAPFSQPRRRFSSDFAC